MILPEVIRTHYGPFAPSASPRLLSELLTEFERAASAAGAPTQDWLAEGIDASVVFSKMSAVGLIANDELVAWFGWHNGIRGIGGAGARVVPFFSPASLDEGIARYRNLVLDFIIPANGTIGANPNDMKGAGFGWLNLCSDNYGFAVACRSEARYTPLVRHVEDEWDDPGAKDKLQIVSLCTLVTWWIQGIRDAAVVWDPSTQTWSYPESKKLPPLQVEKWFV